MKLGSHQKLKKIINISFHLFCIHSYSTKHLSTLHGSLMSDISLTKIKRSYENNSGVKSEDRASYLAAHWWPGRELAGASFCSVQTCYPRCSLPRQTTTWQQCSVLRIISLGTFSSSRVLDIENVAIYWANRWQIKSRLNTNNNKVNITFTAQFYQAFVLKTASIFEIVRDACTSISNQ